MVVAIVDAVKLMAFRRVPLLKVSGQERIFCVILTYVGMGLCALVTMGVAISARTLLELAAPWWLLIEGALAILALIVVSGENLMGNASGLKTCLCSVLGYSPREYYGAKILLHLYIAAPALLPLAVIAPGLAICTIGVAVLLEFYLASLVNTFSTVISCARSWQQLFRSLVYLPGFSVIRLAGLFSRTVIMMFVVLIIYRFINFNATFVSRPVAQVTIAVIVAFGFKSAFFHASALNMDFNLWKILSIKPLEYHLKAYGLLCIPFTAAAALGLGIYSVVAKEGLATAQMFTLIVTVVSVSLYDYCAGRRYAKYSMDKISINTIYNTKFFVLGKVGLYGLLVAVLSLMFV